MSDAIFDAAISISEAAATTAMSYFRGELDIDVKGDNSPVTVADKQIEQDVRDVLASRFPDHSILGEEYGTGDLTNESVWVIDPIDGTRSFISGHPLFGFLLAYLNHGEEQISIVSMPAIGERFVGRAKQYATLNGKPIETSRKQKIAESILYINEAEKIFLHEPQTYARLMTAGHTRRFGYDCYPHALLAAGFVDVVVDYDLKPFDFLPLSGLVKAAGGVITDWAGERLSFSSDGRVVSAATPELHKEVLVLLSHSV